jgi:hypothetical protein
MKNKYEIVSDYTQGAVVEKINEYMASGMEVAFLGGVSRDSGIYSQAILLINKESIEDKDVLKGEVKEETE